MAFSNWLRRSRLTLCSSGWWPPGYEHATFSEIIHNIFDDAVGEHTLRLIRDPAILWGDMARETASVLAELIDDGRLLLEPCDQLELPEREIRRASPLPTWGFNGAAVLRPRKPRRRGPTPERGRGFNGAAVLRPRKRALATCVFSASVGFNGAAVLRPRKLPVNAADSFLISKLQWGRGFEAAET